MPLRRRGTLFCDTPRSSRKPLLHYQESFLDQRRDPDRLESLIHSEHNTRCMRLRTGEFTLPDQERSWSRETRRGMEDPESMTHSEYNTESMRLTTGHEVGDSRKPLLHVGSRPGKHWAYWTNSGPWELGKYGRL